MGVCMAANDSTYDLSHARTRNLHSYVQSMFSLMPSWSVTLPEEDKAAQSLDDEKNEETVVLQRVKARINKVLQSRLAGEFGGARILALECTWRPLLTYPPNLRARPSEHVSDTVFNSRQARMLLSCASMRNYSWRSRPPALARKSDKP